MLPVYLAIAGQTAIAAVTYLVAKRTLQELGAAELAFLRFEASAACFALLLAARGQRLLPPRELWGRLALLGLVGLPLNQGLFLAGLALSSPAHAAILYALTPAVVLLGARIFLGERVSAGRVLGIAVAFGGVALVLLERGLAEERSALVGDLLVLGAVLAWAAFTVWLRPISLAHGPLQATGWTLFAGAALSLPAAPWLLPRLAASGGSSTTAWLGVIWLVVATSVVGYLLWSFALSRLQAAQVAIFTNLQPVATALLSWIWLGERIGARTALGGLLVIAGVTLLQRREPEPG